MAKLPHFDPISLDDLCRILDLTIKHDRVNKIITFLCQLSAYLDEGPFNISFNAPSSTGKSYLPTEIVKLFPPEDVIEVGYCSPTAFFHDIGDFDKATNTYLVDLSRKILILLDQPHPLLLQHLRPVLSHDKKELKVKIADKSQKAGLRTKNIILKGYPAVIFCSAGLKLDEQEATRFVLLSPDTTQEKFRAGIQEKIKREARPRAYRAFLEANPKRKMLMERIVVIRDAGIRDVSLKNPEDLEKRFLGGRKTLKPRHQRDIGRIIAIAKVLALLNLWNRERSETRVVANEVDIDDALEIWRLISKSQELNLPPYVLQVFDEVILPAWKQKNFEIKEASAKLGLSRSDISAAYFQRYDRPLPIWLLRQEILPMLENAGLVYQEVDPEDKRRRLVYPTAQLTISDENKSE